jgi:hypothetical protein
MSKTIAITDAITTIAEAEQRFGLIRNEDPDFFWEWQRCSAELTGQDTSQLADLRRRYIYHRSALPTTARIIRCQKFIDSLAIDRVDLLGFIDRDEFAEGQVFIW